MSQHQETKKERIIRTALEIFAHKGFHPATMAEIAKASGVAKGSLYNYFTSKEDLLKKLILETIGEVGHMIDPDGNAVNPWAVEEADGTTHETVPADFDIE